MAKAIKPLLTVVGAAVGFVALGPAGIFVGGYIGNSLGNSAKAILAPKVKAPATSPSSEDRLTANIDLRTPRKIVVGSTAMATDIRDQEWSADQSYLDRFIVVASHRVQAIREIWFDDKLAWSAVDGIGAPFAGYLTVTPVLEGSAANAIFTSGRMGSSRRFTGCAYVHIRYKLTGNGKKAESPFATTIPSRMTIVGDGLAVYDPRLDSTAGGSGSQRANDQSTWAWTESAGRNPALQLLTYLLGWRINGRLAVGKGLPAARIDVASFMTAANLCDKPVARSAGGTEPRYRADGIFSEGDDLRLVLDNFKAAMNAELDDADGRIRISILYNDLASPRTALGAADVLGDFTWDQTEALSDTVNIMRGGYTDASAASLYQMVDYPEVRIAAPDGIDRVETVNLPLVQSASQAQRLVKLKLQRALYAGTFTAVFQATAWRYQKGDIVPFTFPPLGFAAKLFRVAEITIQVDGTVPMTLREEHPSMYAWDASDAAPVVGAAPTVYQPNLWPIVQGIVDVQDALSETAAKVARAGSDGWLDTGEKRDARISFQALNDDWAAKRLLAMDYEAASPAIGAARVAADSAIYNLGGYLNGLTPYWLDTSVDTPVDPVVYRNAWASAYARVSELTAALSLALDPELSAVVERVARVASDGWLTAGEKPAERIAFQALNDDWSAKRSLAMAYEGASPAIGAARVDADNAIYALGGYLNGLTPSWIDSAVDTPIDAAAYRNAWGPAYAKLSALTAQLSLALGPSLKAVTDRVDRVASDSWLTASEKPAERIAFQALNDDWLALRTKAINGGLEGASQAIGAARVAADDAIYALSGYLNGLTPYWLDATVDTPIVPAEWRNTWGLAYQRVADLNAAITGQPGSPGASAFTLADVSNCSNPGLDSVTKRGGGSDWNGKARTVQGFRGSAAVSGQLPRYAGVGLTTDPDVDAGPFSIDYWLFVSPDGPGQVQVYRNGANVFSGGNAAAGARGQVTADGKVVRYFVEGMGEVYSHAQNSPDEVLYGSFAIHEQGSTIGGITFAAAGRAGEAGVSAPQPKTVTASNTALDPILVEPGASLKLEAFVGLQSNSASNASAQIQVAIGSGAYSVAASGSVQLAPNEPGDIYLVGSVTNTATTRVFVTVRVAYSGGALRNDTTNFLKAS